jgi:hypothetical protein
MVETARKNGSGRDRRNDRRIRTGEAQEVRLVVAWHGRNQFDGVPWLLALADELAGRGSGIFLPGLSELRRNAAVRRGNIHSLWAGSLRSGCADCVGKVWQREIAFERLEGC